MAQSPDIQRKLKKKRRRELAAYFREISQKEGLFAAIRRTMKYLRRRHGGKRGRFLPDKGALYAQQNADITGWPKISVLVPVYNPVRQHFDEMVASVVRQSYQNWELCIVNGSDEDTTPVGEVLQKYTDERIVYEEMENAGISGNTNRAARMADGQYFVLLDQDDILSPDCLFEFARRIAETEGEFIYGDEALFENDYTRPTVGHFKPDFSPQYLLNVNYITHPVAIKADLWRELGGMNSAYDGAQDHDLFIRITEKTKGAGHIARVLYYWRQHEESTSTGVEAKPYVTGAGLKAIGDHLTRLQIRGSVVEGLFPSTYKVNYAIRGLPLVSIIIPSCDHVPDLDRCIRSIYQTTQYKNFEVLVVENNSKMVDTFAYYQKLASTYPNLKVLVYEADEPFNFSRICNFGRKHARGDYLLFLNNDTEVINSGWLGEMLQLGQLDNIGVVGAMLYYPDDTIQHAGVITGLGGFAGHSHKYARRGQSGYMFRLACVQELSAVTGACMMVRRSIFDRVGGFDAGFGVAYNDVDFCLRVRSHKFSVLFTPYAELYHYESKSRGSDEEDPEKHRRFEREQERLLEKYGDALLNDPFYSPWLTSDREDFSENDVLPRYDSGARRKTKTEEM